MPDANEVRVHFVCGLCGNRIAKDQPVGTLFVTYSSGRQGSVEIHAECVKPYLDEPTAGDLMDDAATVDERQRIWDKALSKSS
jgi:hypothetical protein